MQARSFRIENNDLLGKRLTGAEGLRDHLIFAGILPKTEKGI